MQGTTSGVEVFAFLQCKLDSCPAGVEAGLMGCVWIIGELLARHSIYELWFCHAL